MRHRKLEHASKCLIRWSPVHCHYEKRLKGIISAIRSLEKLLILPKFAHSISVITAGLGILLGIIMFVSSFTPVSIASGQRSIVTCLFYWLTYLPPKQTHSNQTLCTSSIEDTKHYVKIRGSYLEQKVRYW